MIDNYISYYKSQIHAPLYSFKYQNLRISAVDMSLSFFPLPPLPYWWRLAKLSERIVPYGGMGFHIMMISTKNEIFYDPDEAKLRIDSFLWKAGCNIYIPKLSLALNFEYKHTLNKNRLKNVERFSIGILFGVTFDRSKRITPKHFLIN
jgi:hypothetical protein